MDVRAGSKGSTPTGSSAPSPDLVTPPSCYSTPPGIDSRTRGPVDMHGAHRAHLASRARRPRRAPITARYTSFRPGTAGTTTAPANKELFAARELAPAPRVRRGSYRAQRPPRLISSASNGATRAETLPAKSTGAPQRRPSNV